MTVLHPVPPFAPEAAPVSRQTLADYFQHLSEDAFYAFCQQNREQKFERRADGTIEFVTMTGGTTGRLNTKLIIRLGLWAEEGNTGPVFDSSTGFRLPNGAVRSPDVAWVRTGTWQALTTEQQQKFPPLCPDFVVELVSPSDVLTDVVIKMEEYLSNGCRLGWLIDPKTETARIFRADGSVSVVKTFDKALSGEDVLPGFAFALASLR
ncbi:Uma2 family endonuclease [Hymenobacter sp. IS2118]|uniref:Uma2 family endonuclease n=1 Tax=Hymenobacter sp. IS2118 TaxID=1505605 RepID=UPI00068B8EAF|nr:Uma2 family endonuclease [Hymenobacter sp. IS2118]